MMRYPRMLKRFIFLLFGIGMYITLDKIFSSNHGDAHDDVDKRSQLHKTHSHSLVVKLLENNNQIYYNNNKPILQVDYKTENDRDQSEKSNKEIEELRKIHKERDGNIVEEPVLPDYPNVIPSEEDAGENNFHEDENKMEEMKPEVTFPPFVESNPENGPGENGMAYSPVLNDTEKKKMDKMFSVHHFNVYVSDKISVHRRQEDRRAAEYVYIDSAYLVCKTRVYNPNLPMASVIICFNNEAWSVLLRSVHSILDRTPSSLLREIILVDDASTFDYLKKPLEKYMEVYSKVKILRTWKHEGLTRARLLGYSVAKGDVLVFLDSHIECLPGWLEPLLDRVADDPKNVPLPVIGFIEKNTFETQSNVINQVGVFDWASLIFQWTDLSDEAKRSRRSDADPFRYTIYCGKREIGNGHVIRLGEGRPDNCGYSVSRSPTMPGGLFAIDRDYFTTLGTYDPGLLYWGGENMELSFKVWMCNGSIEIVPCSKVVHLFRDKNPIKWPTSPSKFVDRNSVRVAQVWMDEYKEHFYDNHKHIEFGDVSDRIQLRASLHCHDFHWYVENVLHHPPPSRALAAGLIRHSVKPVCFDAFGPERLAGLYGCQDNSLNQWWQLRENGVISHASDVLCFDESSLSLKEKCGSDQHFVYHPNNQTLVHSPSQSCIQMSIDMKLVMGKCTGSPWQQWILPLKQQFVNS